MKMVRTAAIASLTSAVPLFLVCGMASARAEELSDLSVNQQLLQSRIDQLAQAPVSPSPGFVPPGPVAATGRASLGGSFPRSFLIPGTDVSLRVGGQGVGSVLWFIKGQATGGAFNGQGGFNETFMDGQGGTGNLPNIPLNGTVAHSRSSHWDFSGKESNLYLDARVPSAWGEVKAFVSMDFAASNTNTILNVVEGSTNGYIPRLREGYVSFGGLLAGQTVGTFVDNDSSPELLDFGGQTGINFVARTPQVRYTYLLPMGQSVAVSIEQPNPLVAGPFGTYYEDTNQIPTISSCNPITAITAGVVTGTNITNACLGNAAFFNISQQLAPTFVQRWRIDQPWGHIQIGTTELLYTLNDGSFLNNRQYVGYGAGFSGNTFPGWFGWSKDNITYGLSAGNGIGDQIANNSGLATNFGGNLNAQGITAADSRSNFTVNRKLYDSAVLGRTIPSFGARIGYAHWWTDNLRSNVDFSMNHEDVASLLVGTASTVNKELTLTHVNLIWSPAAFLDLGVEGAWGHRQTVSNKKGDAYTMQTKMKFRF
jgi:hypothetical protein